VVEQGEDQVRPCGAPSTLSAMITDSDKQLLSFLASRRSQEPRKNLKEYRLEWKRLPQKAISILRSIPIVRVQTPSLRVKLKEYLRVEGKA